MEKVKKAYVGACFTEAEKELIEQAAKKQQMNVSAFLRKCIEDEVAYASGEAPDPGKKLLSIKDAEACLHVSRSTIDKLIKSGELRHIRVSSGTVRVTREALDEFLEKNEQYRTAPKEEKAEETQLSTTQVAHMLGVTAPTVIRWIEAGRLQGHRYGNRYKIRKSDAVDFMNQNKR